VSTYVLISGSWFGSWCWEKVVPLLERQGHTVVAPDLLGYGGDTTPLTDVTLRSYAERVCQVLDAQAEPVILVGHSRGGIAITQAAEYRPDKIATLVYLCAFLPRNGESMAQLAQQDTAALTPPHLAFAEDQSSVTFEGGAAAVKEVFCQDCADGDVARAAARLIPDALAPWGTPLQTTEERFGRVPRAYIQCLRDRTITPALQRQMYTAVPCQTVVTLDTGHAPFYAAPADLAMHLDVLSS
jgi:pimeloyl-ACP methyl ester carboxylesterase